MYLKRKLLPVLFFIFFVSNNSFSQKISYRNLIGVWEMRDSGKQKSFMILEFDDSINCSLRTNTSLGKFTYSIEIASDYNVIRLDGIKNNGVKGSIYLLIKAIENGIFKCQETKGDRQIKWDNNETKNNTFFLVRTEGVVSPPK